MKKQIFRSVVWFFLGLVVGFGILRFWSAEEDGSRAEGTGETTPEMISNEAMLLDRIREKDAEIAQLKLELRHSNPGVVEPVVVETVEEPETKEDPLENRRARFLERMDQRIDGRASEMGQKYGLNEQEAEALKDVFRRQFESFQARRRGEEAEPFNLDDEIAGILTEEQFAQYLEDSQQEIFERAELLATTQLVRMNQHMELTPDAQDEVYETLHYTAQEMMIARQTGEDFDMRQQVEDRLGTILTAEQLETYQDLSARRRGPGEGPPPAP